MKIKYKEGPLEGKKCDYGKLSKEKMWKLESAMFSNTIQDLNNSKLAQCMINQDNLGVTNEEILEDFTKQIKSNCVSFLAKVD